MQHEPTRLEVFLNKLAFLLYGKSVYKAFADSLLLKGDERVLDFGCGMGTVAYYVSKRLTNGKLTCMDVSERWLNACRKNLRRCENVDFLHKEASVLSECSFDVVYCHFVLHDISEDDLKRVVPALVKSLRSGGRLIFREPLNEHEKLEIIRGLINQNGLLLKESRITDLPLMGNTLESVYIK